MPDRNRGEFLEARLRAGIQPRRARRLVEELTRRVPGFAWPYLVLLELSAPDEADGHFRAFRRLCPESLAPFAFASKLRAPALVRNSRDSLAALLAHRSDDEAVRARPWLWDLSKRLDDLNLNVLRFQIVRLRLLDRPLSSTWRDTLGAGYRLLNDTAGLDALSRRASEVLTPESLPQFIFDRWERVQGNPRSTPNELTEAAENYLDVASRYPDLLGDEVSMLSVAEAYSRRGIEPATAERLASAAVPRAQVRGKYLVAAEAPETAAAARRAVTQTADRAVRLGATTPKPRPELPFEPPSSSRPPAAKP
jgi:hypothetical protein